jgi:hypothetical protein
VRPSLEEAGKRRVIGFASPGGGVAEWLKAAVC